MSTLQVYPFINIHTTVLSAKLLTQQKTDPKIEILGNKCLYVKMSNSSEYLKQ